MKTYPIKRRFERVPCSDPLTFTVLTSQDMQYEKIRAFGTVIDSSPAGIGLISQFPLQPGYVLQWDDMTQKGNLHMAIVKWSFQQSEAHRAGLELI